MSMFIDDGQTAPQKAGKTRYKRTMLAKGTLYILNEDDGNGGGSRITTVHEQKCNAIKNAFKECSSYKVCVVPRLEDTKEFLQWWKDKLRHQSDDQIAIIYFHGSSGGNGDKFGFALAECRLNAYRLFQTLTKCEKNVLMLLDCYLPTRFHDKSRLQRRLTCEAAFEVIACGHPGQDTEGTTSVSRFTDCIIDQFEELINRAREEDKTTAKAAAKGKASAMSRSRRAPFSISQMLRGCDVLNTNPVRLWSSHTRPEFMRIDKEKVEMDKVVPRLYINPDAIRKHKKIVFQCDVIKDTEKARRAEKELAGKAGEPASTVDEGFDEEDEGMAAD